MEIINRKHCTLWIEGKLCNEVAEAVTHKVEGGHAFIGGVGAWFTGAIKDEHLIHMAGIFRKNVLFPKCWGDWDLNSPFSTTSKPDNVTCPNCITLLKTMDDGPEYGLKEILTDDLVHLTDVLSGDRILPNCWMRVDRNQQQFSSTTILEDVTCVQCRLHIILDKDISPETSDPVNHPSHYTAYKNIEVIDLTEQMNFNKGNAVKYIARAGLKDPEKEIEDLEKAIWFIQREIKRISKSEETIDNA